MKQLLEVMSPSNLKFVDSVQWFTRLDLKVVRVNKRVCLAVYTLLCAFFNPFIALCMQSLR